MRSLFALLLVLALSSVALAAPPRPVEDAWGRPLPVLTPTAPQAVSYTDTAAASTAFTMTAIRLVCTSACFYTLGATPTATSSSHYLPAGVPYDMKVVVGEKVSVVRAATSGTAYITEWQ